MKEKEVEMMMANTFLNLVDTFGVAISKDAIDTMLLSCKELAFADCACLFEVDPAGDLVCTATTGNLDETDMLSFRRLVDRCRFGWCAMSEGISGVQAMALPLTVGSDESRVVGIWGIAPAVSPDARAPIVSAFLAAAGRLIDQSNRSNQSRQLASQLQGALDSRVIIEQAKGILAERHGQDMPSAFQRLRQLSRESNKPIAEVAKNIVAIESQ